MLGRFDNNPLIEFRDTLLEQINYYINSTYITDGDYKPIDNLVKYILLNNGCRMSNNGKSYGKDIFIMNHTYGLYFVTGIIGNDVNKIYDLIDIDGMMYFVIFLDTFTGIDKKFKESEDDSDINNYIDSIYGKSMYFTNICKLVNIFLKSITNPFIFTNGFLATAITNNYKCYAPYIIAGYILFSICDEITENDIEGAPIQLDELLKYMSTDLSLYGVRIRDEIDNGKNNV